MIRASIVAMTIAIGTAGCTSGLHSDEPAVETYVLRATGTASPAAANPLPSLRVQRPLAAPGLDTERIVLMQADHRSSYYAGSRWAARLPEVVQALAVERFRATGAWSSVEDARLSIPAHYLLEITVRRFEADYTAQSGAPIVHVSLDCAVVQRTDRELVTSFTAESSASATENRLGAVVDAFERAANEALATAAERSAAAVRTSKVRSPPAGDSSSS
jgi:cholesterol transport system auxiliary component